MDPSGVGRLTRSRSRSRSTSKPPSTAGMTTTPSAGTPPHCTDKPWTKAVRGDATTQLAAARYPSQPNHPFETTNPFATLQPPHDDSTDDGSGQSANILLTPADGDIVATVAVFDDIATNVDGARAIATIGTTIKSQ